MRTRSLAILLLVVAAAVSAWLIMWNRAPASRGRPQPSLAGSTDGPSPGRLQQEIRAVNRQLRGLAHELARLRELESEKGQSAPPADHVQMPTLETGQPSVPTSAAESATQPTEPGQRSKHLRDREMWARVPPLEAVALRAAAYDEVLDREPWDPGWSSGEEQRIRESAARPGVGDRIVLAADCGTSLCRANLRFSSTAGREEFWLTATVTEPWAQAGEGFMHCEGWDDTDVEVYYARSGGSLPYVAPPTPADEAGGP